MKSFLRGRVQLGQAEDLAPGGMTLRRLPELPAHIGTAITLTFALPDETGSGLLRVSGVVVSDCVAGTFRRTGVRFAALPNEVQQRISRFCTSGLVEAYTDAALSTA